MDVGSVTTDSWLGAQEKENNELELKLSKEWSIDQEIFEQVSESWLLFGETERKW